MALPRFTRRPSDSRMMRCLSGNSISSTCGLMLVHFRLRRPAIWISLSKWPMLQTMARYFIAFHRRLQRADRIDFGNHDAAAGLAQRGGRALADVAEARDHRGLAGHHHVGAAADAVDQRFTAAIEVVELRLGHAVVDVDRRPQQRTSL